MFSSYFSLNCATMLHNASVHLVLTLLTMSTYYFRNCGFSVSFATTFDFCKSLQSGGESSRAFVLSTRFCSFLQGYYHLLCYYISSPTQLLDWSVFYKHFPLYSLCLYQQSLTSLIFSYQNARFRYNSHFRSQSCQMHAYFIYLRKVGSSQTPSFLSSVLQALLEHIRRGAF